MGCYFEKQSIKHAFIQFGSYLAGPLRLEIWVLARPNRPKYGYWPDRTDRNMGIGQTEQTEKWVLARPNRPKYGYWPDRNLGIGQTEQTEIWVLARPNRPKYGYWPDRTDRNMGIGQTEQTEIWVFARPNRLKLPLARRKARPKFLPDHCGRSHRTPLSATQVGLASTCLGWRTSSWDSNRDVVLGKSKTVRVLGKDDVEIQDLARTGRGCCASLHREPTFCHKMEDNQFSATICQIPTRKASSLDQGILRIPQNRKIVKQTVA